MAQILPALWRTLLQGYLRTLLLSVSTFLAVLVVTRFKEIARFTALSGDWGKTLLFTAYQFPLILPIAIPISALLSATLLFQRLSRTQELTAFRASGLSFPSLLAPLLFASAFLSIGNFSICAELAPFCRKATKMMLFRETSESPLLLLQRQNLSKLKHAYLDLEPEEDGKSATNVTLIAYNESQKRLIFLQAERLSMEGEQLRGQHVALISHPNGSKEGFDLLMIENQASMSMAAPILTQCLKKRQPKLQTETMRLPMLLQQAKSEKKRAASGARIEILRRLSLSCAVFSFTLLGCAFGATVGRNAKPRYLPLFILAVTVLASYLTGKELKSHGALACCVFLLPHPLIWAASIWRLRQLSQGAAT